MIFLPFPISPLVIWLLFYFSFFLFSKRIISLFSFSLPFFHRYFPSFIFPLSLIFHSRFSNFFNGYNINTLTNIVDYTFFYLHFIFSLYFLINYSTVVLSSLPPLLFVSIFSFFLFPFIIFPLIRHPFFFQLPSVSVLANFHFFQLFPQLSII